MSGVPTWLVIAVAGALGTLARFALGVWIVRATGGAFPWGTLAVNLSGSLVIGLLAGAFDRGALVPPLWRMALMVGFLGGYTTFSSFALESLRLATAAQWRSALAYVALTNVGGLAAVWAGYRGALSL